VGAHNGPLRGPMSCARLLPWPQGRGTIADDRDDGLHGTGAIRGRWRLAQPRPKPPTRGDLLDRWDDPPLPVLQDGEAHRW
jgi:hypothetical protein